MGLLTPKNSKADRKAARKKQPLPAGSAFIKSNTKPVGVSRKPPKTGGTRGS